MVANSESEAIRKNAIVFSLIFPLILFASCSAFGQDFYRPVDEKFAKDLGIDVAKLKARLGIDGSAEKIWADRYRKLCATSGAVPSKCSAEGKSTLDMKTLADSGEPILQNNCAHWLDKMQPTNDARNESFKYLISAANQGLGNATWIAQPFQII